MNAGRFGGGFLVGVVLAVVMSGVFGGDAPAVTTSTATSTTAPRVSFEPWFKPGEAVIGSTVLLPVSVDIDGGTVFFDYELAGLAPTLFGDHGEGSDLAMAPGDPLELPETWELVTVDGATVAATTETTSSSVSFELPGADDEVASITLTGWRVPVPFGESVTIPIEPGATGELRSGTVTVSSVLEQSISTVVAFDVDHSDDRWLADTVLRPRDAHWRVSGNQFGGFQVTWNGDGTPGSIVVEDVGFEMRPVTGSIVVYEAEVAP